MNRRLAICSPGKSGERIAVWRVGRCLVLAAPLRPSCAALRKVAGAAAPPAFSGPKQVSATLVSAIESVTCRLQEAKRVESGTCLLREAKHIESETCLLREAKRVESETCLLQEAAGVENATLSAAQVCYFSSCSPTAPLACAH